MLALFLLVQLLASSPMPEQAALCQLQPPFTVSSGSPETLRKRAESVDLFYAGCHGRPHSRSTVTFWSYGDGSLRRDGGGDAVDVWSLDMQVRTQGVATFVFTPFRLPGSGAFCHFRRPFWTEAELDELANKGFQAMKRDPSGE
jgi:hypothetical protein